MYAYKINKSINQYQGFLFTNLLHVPQLRTWEHSSLSMFGEYTFLLYLTVFTNGAFHSKHSYHESEAQKSSATGPQP